MQYILQTVLFSLSASYEWPQKFINLRDILFTVDNQQWHT